MNERNLICRWWQLWKTTLPANNLLFMFYKKIMMIIWSKYNKYNYIKVIVIETTKNRISTREGMICEPYDAFMKFSFHLNYKRELFQCCLVYIVLFQKAAKNISGVLWYQVIGFEFKYPWEELLCVTWDAFNIILYLKKQESSINLHLAQARQVLCGSNSLV